MNIYNYFFPQKATVHPYLTANQSDLDGLSDDMLVEIAKKLPLADLLKCRRLSSRWCQIIDENFSHLPKLFAIAQLTKECLSGNRSITGRSYISLDEGDSITSLFFQIYPVKVNSRIKYQELSVKTAFITAISMAWPCILFSNCTFDKELFQKNLGQTAVDLELWAVQIDFEDDQVDLNKRKIRSVNLSIPPADKQERIPDELINRLSIFDVADKVIRKSS